MKPCISAWGFVIAGASCFAPALAFANQAESKGLVEDSELNLLLRNIYWNMDRHEAGRQDNREWGQGAQLAYTSGFTQGSVGVGVDLNAYAGVKLDSGRGRSGSQLFPTDSDNRAEDEFSSVGGAVKMQVSKSIIKYGDLRPYNPVIALADARLVPATAIGIQLTSDELDGVRVSLDAGHFTSGKDYNRSGSDGGFFAGYAGIEGGDVDYLGGTWSASDALSVSAYASRYEDLWRQYYGNAVWTLPLSTEQSLAFDFNIYRSLDDGKSLAGEINTTTWSLATSYSVGAHTVTWAYQKNHGDQPFDYLVLGGGGYQDSIYLANSMMLVDFNGPREQSVRLGYSLNMSSYGIPGLTFYGAYTRGDNVDGSKVEAGSAYDFYANTEKHWERDFEAKYVVQSGKVKDLSLRLRYATHRISGTSDVNSDQVRLIVQYPLSLM